MQRQCSCGFGRRPPLLNHIEREPPILADIGRGDRVTTQATTQMHKEQNYRKGWGRYKQKDAYDIYYCIRNYPGGIGELAEACRPILDHPSGAEGYRLIEKFDKADGHGPNGVRRFVADTQILGDRTPEQWQQDAFGQVDEWLRALGLTQ